MFVPAPQLDIRQLYDRFDAPMTDFDCGLKCAPHNPNGIPFCCDICHAVPAAYTQEWVYLQQNTDLWQTWRGDECAQAVPGTQAAVEAEALRAETPGHMLLLACLGPARCQRAYRAISCRQFPFFPYISSDLRFLGLAYEWAFEQTCWVISNLGAVTPAYRQAFIAFYDRIFAAWPADLAAYYQYSEQMRADFSAHRRRIPLLHRSGFWYLLSPGRERLRRVPVEQLRRFGPYRQATKNKMSGRDSAWIH